MNADRLYQELKDLCERMGVEVSEQNFRATGIKARSGHCVVRGNPRFLIDKNKKLRRRIRILSEFLGAMVTEDVYMVPVVRDHLAKFKPHKTPTVQPELFPADSDKNE